MDPFLLLKAAFLGVVEGATEFVPVSSTGHLILVSEWLDFTGEEAKTFAIFIQLGAILAITWLYRTTLVEVATGWRQDPQSRRFILNLAVAFLPAALVGFFAHGWIKAYLFNPVTVAFALVVGGIGILLIERWNPTTRVHDVGGIPLSIALGIGLAQVFALFPGVSRSGATIMGAYGLGLSRKVATEFSFFLAIPVMFAATLFDLAGSRDALGMADLPVFAVGFVVSFIAALVVVKAFLAFVSKNSFRGFAWYRIVFGLTLLAFYLYAMT
jgi:undecaprenyl-diphosphatase